MWNSIFLNQRLPVIFIKNVQFIKTSLKIKKKSKELGKPTFAKLENF